MAITIVTSYFYLPFNEALFFGLIVLLSSTTIVMKILQTRKEVDTLQSRTLLGIHIFYDVTIIPMILITPILVGSNGPDLTGLPVQIGKGAGLLRVIIICANWIVPAFLFRAAHLKNCELFLITSAGTCIGIGWPAAKQGFPLRWGRLSRALS